MGRLDKLLTALKSDAILFPSDMTKVPYISIKGNKQFTLENDYSLQLFSAQKIIISYEQGLIEITGTEMVIKAMYKEEMIIEGTIHSIQFL